MRFLLIILALLTADPTDIARNNKLKREAESAFQNGDYEIAAGKYSMLYDSLGVTDPGVGLNLAHSYYALGDSANARLNYQSVASGSDKKLKSIAYQQLGVMAKTPSTLKESLQYLKAALKADPSNEEARYNYEVVKKLLEQQQQQNQDQKDQNQDQQQDKDQDKENQDKQEGDQKDQEGENEEQKEGEQQEEEQQEGDQQKDQEGEEKEDKEGEQQEGQEGENQEEKESEQSQGEESEESENEEQKQQSMSTQQKLEEMNLSEEKAQMILEALKNNEVQYIQQQRRRATKPKDSDKPDW